MNRGSTLLWLLIVILLLIPTAAGRFLLDIAGGLLIILFLLPILLAGAGWIGWKLIQSKLTNCSNCGASFPNNLAQCPICGSEIILDSSSENINNNIPASSATIDIKAEESN